MDPLVFEPYARPLVWGQRRLETRLGKVLPQQGPYGESWEISAHALHVSRVAEGPFRDMSLVELWDAHGPELYGKHAPPPAKFPLLIKYLDCHEQLSVQVHPNDELARQLTPGEGGKTEAWVVIDAEPSARIYAGLRPGTTSNDLEWHLRAGTVAECLHSFVPKPGDCLFLRAGTVHAAGGGVVIAEVQQTSDATFRLFDWNRVGPDGKPRATHVQAALHSIDWTLGPVDPLRPARLAGLPDSVQGELLVKCPYFELARFHPRTTFALPGHDRLSIWMVIDGSATLFDSAGEYSRTFRLGETVLVPAVATGLSWSATDVARPPILLAVWIP